MKLETRGRKGNRRKALKIKKHVKESQSGRGEKVTRKGTEKSIKNEKGERKEEGIRKRNRKRA
jgi:hypothetical protein